MEITKQKERESFSKKVGIGEWKVLAFNPTRKELNQLLGRPDAEDDKEIDYVGENADGKKALRLTVWVQDVKSGYKTSQTFFLEDVDAKSKSGKLQFINAVGKSTFKDSEANLDDWFKKALTYRVAKRGEADLMEFVRNWMINVELNVDKGGSRNNILLDMNKLFKGNVKELNDLIRSEYDGTIVSVAMIKTKGGAEGEPVKYYQSLYTRKFLPGYCMKYFDGTAKGAMPKYVQEFIDSLEGEYGPKDYFVVEPLRDYVEGENPMSTDSPIIGTNKY